MEGSAVRRQPDLLLQRGWEETSHGVAEQVVAAGCILEMNIGSGLEI